MLMKASAKLKRFVDYQTAMERNYFWSFIGLIASMFLLGAFYVFAALTGSVIVFAVDIVCFLGFVVAAGATIFYMFKLPRKGK